MTDITTYKFDAAFAPLEKFDHGVKPGAFIEVSLWHNGAGFDAHLSSWHDQSFKLTWGRVQGAQETYQGAGS